MLVQVLAAVVCACASAEADPVAIEAETAAMGDGNLSAPVPHRGPPQQALDACAALSDGEACRFTLDGRTLSGACRRGPDPQGPFACLPGDRPPPPPFPPREAVDACTGLAAGAACSFAIDGRTLTGTCRVGPDGSGPTACAPADMPPPPPRR